MIIQGASSWWAVLRRGLTGWSRVAIWFASYALFASLFALALIVAAIHTVR